MDDLAVRDDTIRDFPSLLDFALSGPDPTSLALGRRDICP